MLTPGLFDIRFREQFDLLLPLKLSGRPSERQPWREPHPQSTRGERRGQSLTGQSSAIKMTIKDLLIGSGAVYSLSVSLSGTLFYIQTTPKIEMQKKHFKRSIKFLIWLILKVTCDLKVFSLSYWKDTDCKVVSVWRSETAFWKKKKTRPQIMCV